MAGRDESHTNIDEVQIARLGAVDLARGTVLAGRYQVETTLGRGGAGLVLRAYDRELREAVAIKVLRPDLGQASRWIERLAREVKLARQLRHPNVCRVFDFEKAEGQVFIVMELATGGTLRRELDEGAPAQRPLEARLADARAVAAGLAAIHEAGIAHRDVTPQNVLRMADGRLVVSDFGLATEVSQTTTSIHGGTVAYMAPEVVRGDRGSFASDVWALGVVVHEIVFGERPTWSKPVGGALVAPGAGRTLSRGERAAFSVCRACTAERPAQRPRSARDVEAWLGERRVVRAPAVVRRTIALGLVLIAAAGLVAVTRKASETGPVSGAKTNEGPIPLTGQPEDWSKTSKLLAAVDERVRCLLALPDRRTLRFVWGAPPHAEDVDTTTGARTPARLVPAAYADGCPDLALDGKRLLYQGFTADGRAYAFVSRTPDGRNAEAVVPMADPSVSSEPRWLSDGMAFSLDVDGQHMGVFSTATNRLTVLPEPTHENYYTSFRLNRGGQVVYVSALVGDGTESEIAGTVWPSLVDKARFRLSGFVLDLATNDDRTFIASTRSAGSEVTVLRVVPEARQAVRVGSIADPTGLIRYFNLIGNDLAFARIHLRYDAWLQREGAAPVQLTNDGTSTDAVECGRDFLVKKWESDDSSLWRVSNTGAALARVPTKPHVGTAACSADGQAWYYAGAMGLYRCDAKNDCHQIFDGAVVSIALSPDGARLTFIEMQRGIPRVRWLPSTGGAVHEVCDTETMCRPGWSSNHTIWVSRRRGRGPVWIEVDIDSGKETGKTVEGSRGCSDLLTDPKSPVPSTVKIVMSTRSEIRLQRNVVPSR